MKIRLGDLYVPYEYASMIDEIMNRISEKRGLKYLSDPNHDLDEIDEMIVESILNDDVCDFVIQIDRTWR